MRLQCSDCLNIFDSIGSMFNSGMDTVDIMGKISEIIVNQFSIKGCHFRLLSRDQTKLEHFASYGLSDEFMNKGDVDAEKSVTEALSGKTVYVADATSDKRIQYPKEHNREGIVSLITVPLKTRGQVVGVMRLSTAEKREFSAAEVDIMEVIASFCTSAIIHSMFHRILKRVTETVRSSLNIDEVMRSIVEVITDELRVRGCTIRLLDTVRKELVLKASSGLSEEYLKKGPVNVDKSVSEVMAGECVAIYDVSSDPRVQYPKEAKKEGISSLLNIPLVIRKQTIGVLRVYTHRPYEFSNDEIFLMKAIGEQCALAIQNAQMYTGIKNQYEILMHDFHQWFDQFYSSHAAPL